MVALPNLNNISMPDLETPEVATSLAGVFDWGESLSTDTNIVSEFYETGWVGQYNLDEILSYAIEAKASDVHISAGQFIAYSINGDIIFQESFNKPDVEILTLLTEAMLSHQQMNEYIKDLDLQFAYILHYGPYSGSRFRVSLGKELGCDYLVFRVISDVIPSLKELNVEDEIIEWVDSPDGLILLCGSTGTGKSTTIASVIRNIQLTQPKKIITIEKPIEYTYPKDGLALIIQRNVGDDVLDFYHGLTAAMRQYPDIILLGEVRDTEEVSELIRASEMGHLAISTMHTNSVSTTLNRIQGLFNGNERSRILSTLADSVRGLGNQILVKDKKGGRFACRELLTPTPEIRDYIANGDTRKIKEYQMKHKITMEYALARAVVAGKCTKKEARAKSSFVLEFDEALRDLS